MKATTGEENLWTSKIYRNLSSLLNSPKYSSPFTISEQWKLRARIRGLPLFPEVQTGSGAHTAFYAMDTGSKAPGREANHLLSSNSEVKNEWFRTSNPLVCLRGLDKDNFTSPPFTDSLVPVNTLRTILLPIHFKTRPFRLVAFPDITPSGIATTLPSGLCYIALCPVHHPFNVYAARISIRISAVYFWCPLLPLASSSLQPVTPKKEKWKKKKKWIHFCYLCFTFIFLCCNRTLAPVQEGGTRHNVIKV
jgi:hypothetical protein